SISAISTAALIAASLEEMRAKRAATSCCGRGSRGIFASMRSARGATVRPLRHALTASMFANRSRNQRSERNGHIASRSYVNSLQRTGSCSLNIFKDIFEEHDAVCRHADCPDYIVVRLGFGFLNPIVDDT